MRPGQRQRYAERIERVIAYLEQRTAEQEAPGLDELASVAALSPFHFHRVYRLMTGESVGETVRRIRLARSMPELTSSAPITAAAGQSGYSSSQAFTRALKQQAGVTPAGVRQDREKMMGLASRLLTPFAGSGAPPPLSVEVVSLEPFRLLAIRNVGDYAELDRGFTRLFELVLEQVEQEDLLGIYGVPHDDPRFVPAGECRFDCALSVGAKGRAWGELTELTLGQGVFARTRHVGDYDAIHESIDALYAHVLEEPDREIGSAPLFIHYLDDPEETAVEDLRSYIYLPLKPDAGAPSPVL